MTQMHEDQVVVGEADVRRLLRAQAPRWADLPVRAVDDFGTDHALFRLGADLVARMPIRPGGGTQAVWEAEWLPRLQPDLPLRLSVPMLLGEPDEDYPLRWSVHPWLPGRAPTREELDTPEHASRLAGFIRALQRCPAGGAGLTGSRGLPLQGEQGEDRDRLTRAALSRIGDLVDSGAAEAVWQDGVDAPPWSGPGVWFHGDLQPGNVLLEDGRLGAVLDWGCPGVGDPACELAVAWNTFGPGPRADLRAELDVDEDTWRRGRAWAVSVAAMEVDYYRLSVPAFRDRSVRAIEQVLAGA
ncbi:aminoglycoside phosphotransferase family protein [Auraticoccus monumenti]|uniref:Predicted kinase, aminoglycoside phosphotransferase (APT) family n=1 Tax=Auraticoccus monumenti TaxID=675864 RepID=A0A1G7C079_9ACTN|nr:aminoglycoside phosphotransferase family protein [Auraticoccus monumenti]SDE32732.1 Predicted kinase, aminoglycoside phosphotransferase (APT) family [Auraticoccus monumenti]